MSSSTLQNHRNHLLAQQQSIICQIWKLQEDLRMLEGALQSTNKLIADEEKQGNEPS